MERSNIIKMKGNPLTLIGPELKPGDPAPDFTLINKDLSPVKLADSSGKVRLLSVVPSLDTPVCSLQTQRFNKELASLGNAVKSYTISADLPFAQGRFCSEHDITNTETLSDHRDLSFGEKYGLAIKDLRLLGRAVIIVDKNDKISYLQLVPEVTEEPNYDEAMEALKKAVG
ncbi:MAG TPA: thiol peroxidase [candidate division Zixibacteria bacterium]|nr:thiol peroxidase [candidate division Zixibacteria bacterium]